ncbi:four-carbon acid sugar kinase family protein [Jiangella alba]|uniref:Putative nucleotide-binding of sugar-metabolising enzyme n=1 Tax=Jiangella alba TaxID=561176 RepID=A0A1H5IVQ2_9ACTN|nr:four-carbon acid sugar kinase family protein [Jiangella alba]SEE44329.1 Putative nucleotide-binding of sugar-metabolising enzyme [Jiangella alba]
MGEPVVLIADDLTGAAESAAAFALRAPRIVGLDTWRSLRASHTSGVVAVDTDSRYVSPELAAERCRAVLALLPPGGVVVKKIDSTLRGPLAAEVAALRELGGLLVVSPALPALGRTVVGGVVLVDGVPLERSAAWAAEPRPAPTSVAEALAPLPVVVVSLAAVRGGADTLATALRVAADGHQVAVCDAETDDDLDRIVAAAPAAAGDLPVRWAGSAGLAHALARAQVAADARLPGRPPGVAGSAGGWPGGSSGGTPGGVAAAGGPPGSPPGVAAGGRGQLGSPPGVAAGAGGRPGPLSAGPILFVVGTAAAAARAQLAALAEHVETVVELDPDELTGLADPPDPADPAAPAGRAAPADPAAPAGRAEPAAPAGPVGRAAPAGPVGRAAPADPVGRAAPAGPADPAEPAGPAGMAGIAHDLAGRTAGRTAVVHLADAAGAARSPAAVEALARVIAPAAREHPALVLTGGETARAVLVALGAVELHVREAWDDGVVVSATPDGRIVVTKPGAFGDPHALVRIAERLTGTRQSHVEHSPHEEDT